MLFITVALIPTAYVTVTVEQEMAVICRTDVRSLSPLLPGLICEHLNLDPRADQGVWIVSALALRVAPTHFL